VDQQRAHTRVNASDSKKRSHESTKKRKHEFTKGTKRTELGIPEYFRPFSCFRYFVFSCRRLDATENTRQGHRSARSRMPLTVRLGGDVAAACGLREASVPT
jgi:hypothetical protein